MFELFESRERKKDPKEKYFHVDSSLDYSIWQFGDVIFLHVPEPLNNYYIFFVPETDNRCPAGSGTGYGGGRGECG